MDLLTKFKEVADGALEYFIQLRKDLLKEVETYANEFVTKHPFNPDGEDYVATIKFKHYMFGPLSSKDSDILLKYLERHYGKEIFDLDIQIADTKKLRKAIKKDGVIGNVGSINCLITVTTGLVINNKGTYEEAAKMFIMGLSSFGRYYEEHQEEQQNINGLIGFQLCPFAYDVSRFFDTKGNLINEIDEDLLGFFKEIIKALFLVYKEVAKKQYFDIDINPILKAFDTVLTSYQPIKEQVVEEKVKEDITNNHLTMLLELKEYFSNGKILKGIEDIEYFDYLLHSCGLYSKEAHQAMIDYVAEEKRTKELNKRLVFINDQDKALYLRLLNGYSEEPNALSIKEHLNDIESSFELLISGVSKDDEEYLKESINESFENIRALLYTPTYSPEESKRIIHYLTDHRGNIYAESDLKSIIEKPDYAKVEGLIEKLRSGNKCNAKVNNPLGIDLPIKVYNVFTTNVRVFFVDLGDDNVLVVCIDKVQNGFNENYKRLSRPDVLKSIAYIKEHLKDEEYLSIAKYNDAKISEILSNKNKVKNN